MATSSNAAASRGAHLTSLLPKRHSSDTKGDDDRDESRTILADQPSIFDVLSQESLMSGLKPAIGHLLKYLATTYGNRFETAYRFYDELYLLFDALLQHHCLRKYDASFSENFYGMKRAKFSSIAGSTLSTSDRYRSLAILVAVPYLRLRLDRLHDRLTRKMETSGRRLGGETVREKVAAGFVRVYPYVRSALEAVTLALQLCYVVSQSSVHSPWLWLAGVRLHTLSAADLARFDAAAAADGTLPTAAPHGLFVRLWRALRSLPGVLLGWLARLFGVGLFFLQFLDFWYSSDRPNPQQIGRLPTPPAPQLNYREEDILHMEPKMCPICHRKRCNDTVLNVSGYVFCYSCIVGYLRKNGRCPITKLPATTDHLIRVFSQLPM